MGIVKRMKTALGKTPRSLQRYYEHKRFDLDIKAIWFGFTAALGIWLLAAAAALLWLLFRGGGTYSYGVYIYLSGVLGVFLGGVLTGTRVQGRGWLHGLWVGLLLAMLGIILRLEVMPEVFTWSGIGRQLLLWSLWGLAGGHAGYYVRERSLRKKMKADGYVRNVYVKKKRFYHHGNS